MTLTLPFPPSVNTQKARAPRDKLNEQAPAVRKHPRARHNLQGGSAMCKLPRVPAVYIIRNTVTGEFYIGGTTNLRARWQAHRHCLRYGKHPNRSLQAAWQAHGEAKFVCTALSLVQSSQRADIVEAEQFWLGKFAAAQNPRCYNTEGKAVIHPKRRLTDETRSRISRALKGKELSKEHRAALSAAHRGKRLSAEHREAIGRAGRGKPGPKPTPDNLAKYRKLSPDQVRELRAAYEQGVNGPTLAARYSIGTSTVYRILNREAYRGVQ